LTTADKHFGEPPSVPDIQVPIWYKSFNSWLPGLLLKKGKGYAYVSTDVHGPPKYYRFLFRESGPEKLINMSNKVMTTPQRETLKMNKWNRLHNTRCMLLLLRRNILITFGTFSFNFTLKSVDCFDCKLYTSVNNSLSINWSSQALFILRARKDVWFPVNLTREWQHSPLEGLMMKVVSKLLT
jgi:hypothetical protein